MYKHMYLNILSRTGIYKDIQVSVLHTLIEGSALPVRDYEYKEETVVFKPNQLHGEIPLKLKQDPVCCQELSQKDAVISFTLGNAVLLIVRAPYLSWAINFFRLLLSFRDLTRIEF